MKRYLGFVIALVLLVFVICGQIHLSNIFTDLSPRVEVSSLDYDIPNNESFQYSDLAELNGDEYSFQKETTGHIMNQPVNIIITNGNYNIFKDFKLSHGSFFTDDASQFGLNVAVISEGLSFRLFKTANSLENSIEINDIPYTIVGVYKQNSLSSGLSSNGREKIYIPAKSDFDRRFAPDVGIQRLLINLDENEIDEFTEKKVRTNLRYISLATDEYIVEDYSSANIIIKQFVKITGFIAAMMLSVLMCKYIYYELKNQVQYAREKLEDSSLKDVMVEGSMGFVTTLISILAIAIIIVILYKVFDFSFYIPSEYISPVSLFDFSYYKELILDRIMQKNLYYSFKMSSYAIFYGFVLIINFLCLIFEMVLLIKLYKYISSFLKKLQKGDV